MDLSFLNNMSSKQKMLLGAGAVGVVLFVWRPWASSSGTNSAGTSTVDYGGAATTTADSSSSDLAAMQSYLSSSQQQTAQAIQDQSQNFAQAIQTLSNQNQTLSDNFTQALKSQADSQNQQISTIQSDMSNLQSLMSNRTNNNGQTYTPTSNVSNYSSNNNFTSAVAAVSSPHPVPTNISSTQMTAGSYYTDSASNIIAQAVASNQSVIGYGGNPVGSTATTTSYVTNNSNQGTVNVTTVNNAAFANAKPISQMPSGAFSIVNFGGSTYNVDNKTGIAYK